jgi:hypothetical protein
MLIAGVAMGAPSQEEIDMTNHLYGDYETEASAICNEYVNAEWEYNVDVNNPEKEEALVSI